MQIAHEKIRMHAQNKYTVYLIQTTTQSHKAHLPLCTHSFMNVEEGESNNAWWNRQSVFGAPMRSRLSLAAPDGDDVEAEVSYINHTNYIIQTLIFAAADCSH